MKDLKNKTVLITGAGRGMGKQDAILFAKEGSRVILTDYDQKVLDETTAELKSSGYDVYSYRLDVSNRSDCFKLAGKIKEEVGPVDVLINNAGITLSKQLLDFSEEEIRRINDVNYFGMAWMMQAFVPDMVARKSGHVVNMCSVGGKLGVPFLGPYSASKAAAIMITDSIRMELRNSGVNFTIVNPFFASTGMFDGAHRVMVARIQKPENVSERILDAVKKNKGEVSVPRIAVWGAGYLRGLSFPKLLDFAFWLVGGSRSAIDCKIDQGRPF
ncbi:MAG: SDR family NAD(P)-dependent oxidoreductase [Actinobacteria bacterium]|nr:SDR family NAD(P)-dependent oxidoreductase [Actinomycetota bacterium]